MFKLNTLTINFLVTSAILASASMAVYSEPQVASLRGSADLNQEGSAPLMQPVENHDQKRERAYPQQAPTIPHDISQYQLDKNYNKCMACHGRKNADESQAPAISVTHYMNRDGEFLAEVSPRRYFCTQCHVSQLNAKPIVDNQFIDMDELIIPKHP